MSFMRCYHCHQYNKHKLSYLKRLTLKFRKVFNFESIKRKVKIKMTGENSGKSELTESLVSPKVIKERSAEILEAPGKNVFYNPVQEFNRDLSVLALQVFSKKFQDKNGSNESQEPFRILEALSASGLRSIRYAKEVPYVTEVIANDFCLDAFKNIELNIKHNNVENIVKPSYLNAVELMFNSIQRTKRFDVVDLDPYGSPIQFLDTAVQCVADGGILLVTCTDTGVLCGVYPETCFAKYGAVSLRVAGKHEMAIRIVLQTIQSLASKYKRYIVPLLSFSVDFYIRVIVQIHTSAATCKEVFSKVSMVYNCSTCFAYSLQPLGSVQKGEDGKIKFSLPRLPETGGSCAHCGGSQQVGGPIWNGPLHDRNFINELINSSEIHNFGTSKRLIGMLTLIQEELYDVPLYYLTHTFCKLLKSSETPIKTLRSAILNAGYRVSNSHAHKKAIKTDAPVSFLWDLFKTWVNENPANRGVIIPGSAGERILQIPIQNKIDFSERHDADPLSKKMGLLRYQLNPTSNWGPGAKGTAKELQKLEKKKRRTEEENPLCKKQKSET